MSKIMDQANREAFFENAFAQYYSFLTKAAVRYVSKQYPGGGIHIEELVQDTFWAAWNAADKLAVHPNISGWLIKTMKYKAMASWRDIKRHEKIIDAMKDSLRRGRGGRIPIMELISQLSHAEAEALDLFYKQGFSVRETAEILNISENAVKVRLSRARENLGILARKKNLLK